MSHPGIGVMLQMLGDNASSVAAYNSSLNKKIKTITFDDDSLRLIFNDGTALDFRDEGRSCCEHRYMCTDDDLAAFENSVFLGAELRDGPEIGGNYDVHEIQFLEIKTSAGQFTMSNHNNHNGYYGGFAIRCEVIFVNVNEGGE